MFTQFFGNYLLNKKLVSNTQLIEAFTLQHSTRLKLGVLAINAGFMTAAQVDNVHNIQQLQDKRFGDIAVDMGYITESQINELLKSQPTGHLLLGQTLVDKGYLSNTQFESALKLYKEEHSITDADFTNIQNNKINSVIKSFYNLSSFSNSEFLTNYISLLFKNLIRFIGDDFTPLKPSLITQFPALYFVEQDISGEFTLATTIEGSEQSFISFASRYAAEQLTKMDDFTHGSVAEFLNLHNGLFLVNMSNTNNIELALSAQNTNYDEIIYSPSPMICIPIYFSFGMINFLISENN